MSNSRKPNSQESLRPQESCEVVKEPTTCQWTPPPKGSLVLNSDGSASKRGCFFGGIIRDHMGVILLGYSGGVPQCDILLLEALGMLRGLEVAQERSMRISIAVTDSQQLEMILTGRRDSPARIEHVIHDIWRIADSCGGISFKHCWRELNQVADFVTSSSVGFDIVVWGGSEAPVKAKELAERDAIGTLYIRGGHPLASGFGNKDMTPHIGQDSHGSASTETTMGFPWKFINSILPSFSDLLSTKIWDGNSFRFWEDKWRGAMSPQSGPSMKATSVHTDGTANKGKSLYGKTSPEREVSHPTSGNIEQDLHGSALTETTIGGPEDTSQHHGSLVNEGRTHDRRPSPERVVSPPKSGHFADRPPSEPFDICLTKREGPPKLKASLHQRNKERRNEAKSSERIILRPGMVLLKKYISHSDQVKITNVCRNLGVDTAGFYQPGYNDGAKLRLQMMCLGKNWDPQTREYGKYRSIDGALAPAIPEDFKTLVKKAIQDSHALIKEKRKVNVAERELPWMEPDLCIVNFYTETGKLGLHQDRDESRESLDQGLPVVSFSIGDAADFLYGDSRDADEAKKVVLESGDVLIFGGESRHVFHGVPSIHRSTAPKFLNEEANLRPGRLNLTFRKY